jgi:hypothetical protein
MKYWIVAFPFIMYLATLSAYSRSTPTRLTDITDTAMGIMLLDQTAQAHDEFWTSVPADFGVPYFSISLVLNVLLTLMIIIRLIRHSKSVRNAMGAQAAGVTGLYKIIITMFIESSALYTTSYLLFIGPWGATNYAEYIFYPALANIQVRAVSTFRHLGELLSDHDDKQVIAPFLIVLRVANRRALTGDTIVSGDLGSIHFKSQGESTDGDETLSNGRSTSLVVDQDGESSGELDVGTRTFIDDVPS